MYIEGKSKREKVKRANAKLFFIICVQPFVR